MSQDSPAGDNKRKYPRLNARRAATVGVDGREFVLATVNLSFGGAFLETDKQVGAGKTITFTMEVDGKQVSTTARVVHQTPVAMAVVFVEPPEAFVSALCQIIGNRVQSDAAHGAASDELPGRVALLVYQPSGYEILFTSSLSTEGAWVIGQRTWSSGEQLWVTLPEYGLFDCQADVVWNDEQAMRLKFVEPSTEFMKAYQRVLGSLAA